MVHRLRRRLDDDAREPALIKTVRSEGYVLAAEWSGWHEILHPLPALCRKCPWGASGARGAVLPLPSRERAGERVKGW